MSTSDEYPWLPKDATDAYDPLEENGIKLDDSTPIAVTPRGGTRSIGRSCYEVSTRHSTFLVDCGLNQSKGGQFPDLRGLDVDDIDAVFLTHAHIDHCGGLPVLEAQGLLDDDAPIFATRPTIQLAHTLLEDSLKLHKREARNSSRSQRFTRADIDAIFERFEPIGYETRRIEEFEHIDTEEHATVQYGKAGHLLGSAWVSIQADGYRVVCSGDLGGRATHLPDIEEPPEADVLVVESTYGAKHSHRSMSTAREDLYQSIADDVRNRRPVLIPTFAVGRAQTVLLKLSERFRQEPEIAENSQVIIDGMAQDATNIYHTHVTDEEFYTTTITGPAKNSAFDQPFFPKGATRPSDDGHRKHILDSFEPEGGQPVPIVVAPSGMLSGGHSQRYLGEFVSRFDDASIYLTGYQANGTPGAALQNAVSAEAESTTVMMDTDPFGTDWEAGEDITWSTTEKGYDRVRVTVATDWVTTPDGFSGHIAQQGLLQFARDVRPETVLLVHGPQYAQDEFATHLAENLGSAEQITRSRMLTPLPITHNPEIPTPVRTPDHSTEKQDMKTQLQTVSDGLAIVSEQVAEVRGNTLTEEEIRSIVEEEVKRQLGG